MDFSKKIKFFGGIFWWCGWWKWWLVCMCVFIFVFLFCFFFNYLRPHSVSPAFVSSSFPGRNYHEPSSRDAAACGPAALCVPVHSISTVPRGRERATVWWEDWRTTTKKMLTHEDGWRKNPREFGFFVSIFFFFFVSRICCFRGFRFVVARVVVRFCFVLWRDKGGGQGGTKGWLACVQNRRQIGHKGGGKYYIIK